MSLSRQAIINDDYSNTTLVKVKLPILIVLRSRIQHSNTTLVKVK